MLIALALCALQSGVLTVDCGLTPSSVVIPLPPADPGNTRVHLSIAHSTDLLHGVETDGVGQFDEYADFTVGWGVRVDGTQVYSTRAAAQSAITGPMVAFDGVYDWEGASGDRHDYTITSTVAIDAPAGAEVRLTARAWVHYATYILGFGSCTTIVRQSTRATVAYTFIP
jgi:hypothetical protein